MLQQPRRWTRFVCVFTLAWPAFACAQTKGELDAAWSYGLGVKAWANEWTSWEVNRVQVGSSSLQALSPVNGTGVSFIPVVSVRHQRAFASASYMAATHYALENSLGTRDASRKEVEANVGYDVLPGVALSAGFKQLSQNVGGEFRWRGPTVAATFSAAFLSGLNAYGTFGIGRLNVRLPAPDAAGATSLNADYTLSEVGLAYSWGRSASSSAPSVALGLGYRAQTVRTRGYALSAQPTGGGPATVYAHDDARDFTQGLTLTAILSF
jgi:hypothetical protein